MGIRKHSELGKKNRLLLLKERKTRKGHIESIQAETQYNKRKP